jgi:Zn-finger nucleic acid-binding protein
MQCPVDQTVLQMSERSGVEIDYCPTCRGVWLDRGELDKILDRAAAESTAPSGPPPDPRTESVGYPQQPYNPGYQPQYEPRYEQGYQKNYDPRYQQKRKKRSFLDEIFD